MRNALRNWHKYRQEEEEAAVAAQMTAEQRANARKETARRRAAMRVIVLSHVTRLLKAGLPGILAMATLAFVAFRVGLVAAVQVGIGGLLSWLANLFINKRKAEGGGGGEAGAGGAMMGAAGGDAPINASQQPMGGVAAAVS